MSKRLPVPSPDYDLTRRTPGEDVWLWRQTEQSSLGAARGRRTGSTPQNEAAEKLGLSSQQYAKLENDDSTLLTVADLIRLRDWTPLTPAYRNRTPTDGELCRLARRRSGRILAEVARELNATTTSYAKWEADNDQRLKNYWKAQGFKFPGPALERPRVKEAQLRRLQQAPPPSQSQRMPLLTRPAA